MEKLEIVRLTSRYFLFIRSNKKERRQGGVKRVLVDVCTGATPSLHLPRNNAVVQCRRSAERGRQRRADGNRDCSIGVTTLAGCGFPVPMDVTPQLRKPLENVWQPFDQLHRLSL